MCVLIITILLVSKFQPIIKTFSKAKGHVPYGGTLSTEFELGDGVDWVLDDEAEGADEDLIWV